jgi:hypothetical protein
LRDVLNTGRMQHRITDSFLIGSYARHTAIKPLDDVDIVFIVDPGAFRTTMDRLLLGRLPEPARILGSFARAIRARYPDSSVRVQRRSVGLKMAHLDIDAVPAVRHPKNHLWLRVPDRRARTWIDSGPLAHTAQATALNKASSGLFVGLVRLLKTWNAALSSTRRLKGFAVETLAARVFTSHPLHSLSSGLYMFFDFVAWRGGQRSTNEWSNTCDISFQWSRSLIDVAGTGHNLFADLDRRHVSRFVTAARVTRDAFDQARRSRSREAAWTMLEKRFPIP